jgi:hypothetical protein
MSWPHLPQPLAELAQALAGPQERRLWIAARLRLDQRAQIIEQARIRLAQRLATTPRSAHPLRIDRLAGTQFVERPTNGAARQARGTRHRCNTTAARRHRLGRRKPPPTPLVEHMNDRRKPLSDC